MDILIAIVTLVFIGAILSAIILPIVALVISIRSRKKLAEKIARLEAAQSSAAAGSLQQFPLSGGAPLDARIQQLKCPPAKTRSGDDGPFHRRR